MATGKKARDIFAATSKTEDLGIRPRPQRARQAEAYQKVTVCLFDRHVNYLDRVALAVREHTGRSLRRAELVRAIVDQAAAAGLDPKGKDFDRAIKALFTRKEN